MHDLPATGYLRLRLRLRAIIGDPKADPPIPAIIPISASSWWAGVKSGRYPQPARERRGFRDCQCAGSGWRGEV